MGTPLTKAPRPRVRLLDGLRGFSVVSMVAYHTLFDLVHIFGLHAPWYTALPGYLWQQSICWVFILVAGASVHYGQHPWRHALLVCGCAAVLTLVTALAMPAMLVRFGVLHMLGVCMLLAAALQRPLRRWAGYANTEGGWAPDPAARYWPAVLGLCVCAALFVFLRGVPGGFVGLLDWPLIRLPAGLYGTGWLFWVGLPGPGFFSSDYFSLVPWAFLFFAGYFGGALLRRRVPPAAPGKNPLEWIGRHSLVIYMAHQPVIYGACLLLAQAGII